MFRNQYDSDVTVWSPEGRLLQVEYAMKAVEQGSATIGMKSDSCVVLVALKRAANELSSYQPKIFELDSQIGVSIAGLMTDARLLIRFMQSESMDHRWLHTEAIPISFLSSLLGSKLQINTQRYGRRPFGVGMLIAGYDSNGTYLLQTCPDAGINDCLATAIGARSQSARTYIEKNLEILPACDESAIVKHALIALKGTLPNEMTLNARNTSVAIIKVGGKFSEYSDEKVGQCLVQIGQ